MSVCEYLYRCALLCSGSGFEMGCVCMCVCPQELRGNIRVCVRVRPPLASDEDGAAASPIACGVDGPLIRECVCVFVVGGLEWCVCVDVGKEA